MSGWTPEFEADLTLLLKDWLKQQGRTQACLLYTSDAADD